MKQTLNSSQQPTIAVIGCGYVGLTTAALFAACGLKVYAVEINPERLKAIQSGRSFFYEAGIQQLLKAGLDNGTLVPTSDYELAIPPADFVISCVGTPDNDDGSANLSYVFGAAEQAARLMKSGAVYVQKSTVPVGTGAAVQSTLTGIPNPISYVSNPEFLRESSAINDALWPDRVVTGGTDIAAADAVLNLYRHIERNRDKLATLCELVPPKTTPDIRYVTTSLASAELIKVSSNAFLALKISFANSIAKLADQAGADVTEVMAVVGGDSRIGKEFLNAGRGYGGGCFPKDVSGLIRSAEDHGVDMEIMRAVEAVNESMPHYAINKAMLAHGSSLAGSRIAVLGLAFKAGTSDTRRSPGITIANTLQSMGATVKAYDPQAMDESDELHSHIVRSASLEEAVQEAEIVFVTTDWPHFQNRDLYQLAHAHGVGLVVDCMNCLNPDDWNNGVRYIGIGR